MLITTMWYLLTLLTLIVFIAKRFILSRNAYLKMLNSFGLFIEMCIEEFSLNSLIFEWIGRNIFKYRSYSEVLRQKIWNLTSCFILALFKIHDDRTIDRHGFTALSPMAKFLLKLIWHFMREKKTMNKNSSGRVSPHIYKKIFQSNLTLNLCINKICNIYLLLWNIYFIPFNVYELKHKIFKKIEMLDVSLRRDFWPHPKLEEAFPFVVSYASLRLLPNGWFLYFLKFLSFLFSVNAINKS